MEQFWTWFLDWWPSIASAITGLVASLATFLVYRFKLRTEKARNVALNQELLNAQLRNTYINCPHCGAEVKLSEMHWKLPGGLPDQNLDGKPDK